MKIYVAYEYCGGGIQEIIGCYSTKELAKKALKNEIKKHSYMKGGCEIQEFDLDFRCEHHVYYDGDEIRQLEREIEQENTYEYQKNQ